MRHASQLYGAAAASRASIDNIVSLCRTQAREELRLQTGTLRFDISTLASQLDKSKRKEALKLGDAFYSKVRSQMKSGYTNSPHCNACHDRQRRG